MARRRPQTPLQLRGQLMLQIASGRFFRPDVDIRERLHRRAVYTNAWLLDPASVDLPVGTITGSTDSAAVSTVMIEAMDRLEVQQFDGSASMLAATGGDELIDDVAYVISFALNRTFSRNHDQVHRLVVGAGAARRRHSAASMFPGLFDGAQIIPAAQWDVVTAFVTALISLGREDFARAMRVIRTTVDATRRAIDDPTGAYTDIVAALESLGDDHLTTPTTWDRYDSAKRKIIDPALDTLDGDDAARVQDAILEADRAGLKRRFVASTLARISPAYFREEAVNVVRPPRAPELERMLGIAYDIRSRRSHVLQDLGAEAWIFTEGAETTVEPNFDRILTPAGLWRLTRHVVMRFVVDAPTTPPEPWDYWGALPGQVQMHLAPQYWIWRAKGFDVRSAARWFNGAVEALISWRSGENENGFTLVDVIKKVEQMVPQLPDGEAKTTMVALHVLWNESLHPQDRSASAAEFIENHGPCLDVPTPMAYTVAVLCDREIPVWTADQWAELASSRHAARCKGNEAPLPAPIDTLLQLEAADQLEAAGRHEEAVVFAANTIEESPGNTAIIAWEQRLVSGDHDPDFDVHQFLYGRRSNANPGDDTAAESREPSMPGQTLTD